MIVKREQANALYPTLLQQLTLNMINILINQSSLSNQSEVRVAPKKQIFNWDGIHDIPQIFLIILLMLASVSVIYTTNRQIRKHDRYLRTYLNLNLLGKNDLSMYEDGLNIDQCEIQFTTVQQIRDHFNKIINVAHNIQQDSIAKFYNTQSQQILFEIQNKQNQFNYTQFLSVAEALDYFQNFQTQFLKSWLLSSYRFKFTIDLGDSNFVEDYKLIAQYRVHSQLMVSVRLDSEYELTFEKEERVSGIRILQQVLAAVIFVRYFYQGILLSRKSKKHRLFRDEEVEYSLNMVIKFRNWYFFLQLMCIIIILSQKYAPICSFVQIVPIFESLREKEEQNEIYSFNTNIRYSFVLVATILFQICIFLNGFIFYSMLLYPGQYFDDYVLGFFSYFYQMFQVGSYEVFTEIEDYGNFAYMLYVILYFYVFLVGNALIPALFVLLIKMKITERFLKDYVNNLVQDSACPKCLNKNNLVDNQKNVQIIIDSPRIYPIISNKKFVQKNKLQSDQSQQALMLFIEGSDQLPKQQNKTYHFNVKFTHYSNKIHEISRMLERQIFTNKNEQFYKNTLQKIEAFLEVKQP